ncbi:hypothetical protein GKE84_08500 [Escherichia coli]|nr:hypothetical protein [Escherichia coli]
MLFSYAFSIFAQDMNVARAVARTKPVKGENWPDFIPVFVGLKVEKKIH